MKVIASLDSRETLESEPIDFKDDKPDFNTELVWTMSRLTFQALRSRKTLLKLQVLENGEKNLGSFQFDLKEATPKIRPVEAADESYLIHATLRKLRPAEWPSGRPPPSIRAALVIEPNEVEVNDEDNTMIDEDLKSQVVEDFVKPPIKMAKERISPILNNDKGYFIIGSEEEASHIFLFNIFICFGRNVQLAFPKDVKVGGEETCTFVYNLFGTQISSKPFLWSKIQDFQPERATAKIFTTPEKLLKFFKEKMEAFCIFVCVDAHHLAIGEVNLAKKLSLSLEDLEAGKNAVFENIVPLESVKQSPEEISTIKSVKSESAVNLPHIGVRFSVGLHPDSGDILKPIPDQSASHNILPKVTKLFR